MQLTIAEQANIIDHDMIAKATGNPITAGTVTFYLIAKTGDNAGKWFRTSDDSWQVAEAAAGVGAHKADGLWQCSIDSAAWIDDVLYSLYVKEGGDLHIHYTENVVCGKITAAAVWDRVISKANHSIANSAGKKLRGIEHVTVLNEGQAQGAGGGNNTIELAETASDVNDWYKDDWVMLVEGTGENQMHHIESYVGSTRIATLGENWLVNPDGSTDYVIIAQSSAHVHRFEQDAKDEINAEVDSALSDYGANTVTPDASGTAAGLHGTTDGLIGTLNNISAAQVNTECDEALSAIYLDYLFAKNYDPASKPGIATALLNELIENDGGISRLTANALEQAPSGAGLSGTQNDALILMRDIMEGDVTIDKTTTPWQIIIKKKSTSTEVLKKDLKDVDGTNIGDVTTVIGQQLEP